MRLHSHSLLIHSTAYTYAYIILFIYNSVFADDLFSLMYFMKSLTSRAPWYFLGFFLLPLGAQQMVGKPETANCDGESLAVASIFAITISLSSAIFSPSSSHLGASDLQCPHHGA